MLFTGLSLIITASAFANVPLSNEKLNIIYEGIIIQSKIDHENLVISPLVCGVSSCSANLIENEILSGSFSLSGEINDKNNVTKVVIVRYDQLGTQVEKAFLVRLSNGELQAYGEERLADHALEHDFFLPNREKRNSVTAWGRAIANGVLGSQVYDHVKEKWNEGTESVKNEYQQTMQNWNVALEENQRKVDRQNQESLQRFNDFMKRMNDDIAKRN